MRLRDYILERKHHVFRQEHPGLEGMAEEFARLGLCPEERMTQRFEMLASMEQPVLLPEEKICFLRTVTKIPDCFTKDEWAEIKKDHFIHESGYISNLCPDYASVIGKGLLACRERADQYGKRIIDAILALSDRYRAQAVTEGKETLAQVLERVPRYGAESFYEALQFFRILHFSLWLEGNYHNTIGRFDQYMYPYLQRDLDKGMLDRASALELVKDFFLSFNKDSDLYFGVQQGDNGQSLMLGGVDELGNQAFNLLSELALEASEALLMIDPKINIRVNSETPDRVYRLGSRLTRAGLGFPQYSNDDVIVPGLISLGYQREDALNYTVAACWEPIIPCIGADIANIGVLLFPQVIDECLHEDLENCPDMDHFLKAVQAKIASHCDRICGQRNTYWVVPSPFMNIMAGGSVYNGGKYNNFGIHGAGLSTAADSLAAIEKYIFREKTITPRQLITAVDSDFAQNSHILPLLRYEAPKMGTGDPAAERFGCQLLGDFADTLAGRRNCRGGIYRAGTGSAMWYVWGSNRMGASPDGRRKGEPFGANYAPSLFARIPGPLSVIRAFTKPNLKRVINGGPLTMEFASSMFASDDSVDKVAALVKAFIHVGGHQMQLNSINSEVLKDAQLHPELHRQLVVRVWGWSAYFTELDKEYQDHVLLRQQYTV